MAFLRVVYRCGWRWWTEHTHTPPPASLSGEALSSYPSLYQVRLWCEALNSYPSLYQVRLWCVALSSYPSLYQMRLWCVALSSYPRLYQVRLWCVELSSYPSLYQVRLWCVALSSTAGRLLLWSTVAHLITCGHGVCPTRVRGHQTGRRHPSSAGCGQTRAAGFTRPGTPPLGSGGGDGGVQYG